MKFLLTMIASLLVGGAAMAQQPQPTESNDQMQTAILAGGCFWCMEPAFHNAEGVSKTVVGYTGGSAETATYEQIGTGRTGHREAILIAFDPQKISYTRLLEIFFNNIDPYDAQGQYVDKGHQYTTAVYVLNDQQREDAQKVIAALEQKSGKKVATVIEPATEFYSAEDYHQDYYKKNPVRYKMYKYGSGRG